jgi:endonuclease-3
MNQEICFLIFTRFSQQNPEPETELHYRTPFELLIAVILSAQATDVRVNMVTKHLFALASTASAIFALGVDRLKEEIKSIGLYNSKAVNIIKTCEILINLYQGEVPSSREALESLPGVGRKTANVVLNTAFGLPTIAVDTHVFRVANRTGLAVGNSVWEVEQGLLKIIPKQFLRHAHHWLVLHGRYVCTARKPHCPSCLIRDLCEYKHKTKE